jgi:hypothetical protein
LRIDQVRFEQSKLSWSNLRPLLSGIGSKAAFAFPIVGYLLVFNDAVAGSLDFELLSGGGTLFLTTGGRLKCLYFGLLLLSVAVVWFRMRAPFSVQVAEDKVAFRQYAFSNFTVYDFILVFFELERKYGYGQFDDTQYSKSDLYSFLDRTLAKEAGPAESFEDDELWFLMKDVEEPQSAIQRSREFLGDLLDAKYDYDEYAKRIEAKALAFLSIAACILLAIPSMDVFVSVVADAFSFLWNSEAP